MTTAPIFQPIFGEQWQHMPPILQKHYANRPNSKDVVTVEGIMDVEVSLFARLLSPLFRLAGALVPYAGKDIPVTVHFHSEADSSAYCFDRIFYFPGKPPYRFRSRMLAIGGNEVVEWMPIGIGWHAAYRFDGKKVCIEHLGYKAKWFHTSFSLLLEWLLGKVYAEEEAVNDNRFRMLMTIHHPLLGKTYAYRGEFTVTGVVYE